MAAADLLRGPGEVAEDEATGAVADAYARLRAALGVNFLPTVVRMLGGFGPPCSSPSRTRWPA